jgi:hypothetical protein
MKTIGLYFNGQNHESISSSALMQFIPHFKYRFKHLKLPDYCGFQCCTLEGKNKIMYFFALMKPFQRRYGLRIRYAPVVKNCKCC